MGASEPPELQEQRKIREELIKTTILRGLLNREFMEREKKHSYPHRMIRAKQIYYLKY